MGAPDDQSKEECETGIEQAYRVIALRDRIAELEAENAELREAALFARMTLSGYRDVSEGHDDMDGVDCANAAIHKLDIPLDKARGEGE